MKAFVLVATLVLSANVTGQSNFEKMILGTWKLQETLDNNPMEKLEIAGFGSAENNEDDSEEKAVFRFQRNGTVDVQEFGEQHKYNYHLSDSILQLGSVAYTVKMLTKDTLILNKKKMLIDQDLILTRSRKSPDRVKKVQAVQARYPSGQPKLSGQNMNGFKSGVWTEWYEDGRVKSVIYYQKEVPFMKIDFDPKGNITSKSWYDMESGEMMSQ